MNKYILPFNYDNQFTWPSSTNLISILSTNPTGYAWVMNNYIQIFCDTNEEVAAVDSYPRADAFSTWLLCELLHYQKISKNNFNDETIFDFIKKALYNGWYIYSMMNQNLLSADYPWKLDNVFHKSLILGHDKEKEQFLLGDNFIDSSNKYSTKWVNEETVIAALKEKTDANSPSTHWEDWYSVSMGWLVLIRINEDSQYKFNKKLLKQYLNDFINSKSHYLWYYDNRDFSFGLEVYNHTIKYLTDLIHWNKKKFDVRIFTMFHDHKLLMLKRIDYLYANNLIDENTYAKCKKYYIKLANITKLALMLYVKIFKKYNIKDTNKIIENLKILYALEKEAIIILIKGL